MQLRDRLPRQVQAGGDLLEVRSCVLDWYPVRAAGRGDGRTLGGQPLDGGAKGFMGGVVGVEMEGHAGVTGDRLPHVSTLFQGGGEGDRPRIQRGIEPGAELGEQSGVTQRMESYPRCRPDGAWRTHVRSQEWRRTCPARSRRRGDRRKPPRWPTRSPSRRRQHSRPENRGGLREATPENRTGLAGGPSLRTGSSRGASAAKREAPTAAREGMPRRCAHKPVVAASRLRADSTPG